MYKYGMSPVDRFNLFTWAWPSMKHVSCVNLLPKGGKTWGLCNFRHAFQSKARKSVTLGKCTCKFSRDCIHLGCAWCLPACLCSALMSKVLQLTSSVNRISYEPCEVQIRAHPYHCWKRFCSVRILVLSNETGFLEEVRGLTWDFGCHTLTSHMVLTHPQESDSMGREIDSLYLWMMRIGSKQKA
jgi:hypothetical protein